MLDADSAALDVEAGVAVNDESLELAVESVMLEAESSTSDADSAVLDLVESARVELLS